jgi:hypothetical protein
VTPPDFFFALDLSDHAHFERMMTDVIASVLRHAGYDATASSSIGDELRRALADGAKNGGSRCDVRFQALGGKLSISIQYDHGREWRTERSLP